MQRLDCRSASGDTVSAAAGPEWRGSARARSTLLAALIRARARPCEDPIEIERIILIIFIFTL